ncbi:MAG: C10 family peptidase [Bacteroidaceae bacterium]|nr:C10 family peptidase [Bacteroidaceae bacterium]
MKRFVFILSVFLLMLPLATSAEGISEQEAQLRADAFFRKLGKGTRHGAMRLSAKGRRKAAANAAAASASYYIFNAEEADGFVIVSGDDRTKAILGYSDSGSIISEDMPDGLKYLLEGYAEQIEWLDGAETDVLSPKSSQDLRRPITPMTSTRWNQGTPYNAYCPEIDDVNSVTGCTATALAQIMFYHKWPSGDCTVIPEYTTRTSKINVSSLPAISFSWGDMTNTYATSIQGGDAAAAELAVGKLMQYCGAALKMDYGTSSSGTYNEYIPAAITQYFGYDSGVRNTYRKNYSYLEWVNLIYSELESGRPVILGGQSVSSGHSFVCDGYDADDYFHINWGWGGSSDGYFRLSALNPYEQGAGGSATMDGFSFSLGAIIGIQPPAEGTSDFCLSLEGFNFSSPDTKIPSKDIARDGESGAFGGINLSFTLYSYQIGSFEADYAVQIFDGSGVCLNTLYKSTYTFSDFNGYINGSCSDLSIPSNISDGTYYIRVMSRPHDAEEWQECFDGDRYQITAVVSGNTLTLTVPITAKVLPTSATLSISGDSEAEGYMTQGYEQEVTATITGGAADYHGNVILRVNGTSVMGKILDIPAGETVEALFTYTPTQSGDNTLALYDAKSGGSAIGSSSVVDIVASDATNTQTISVTPVIENLENGVLFGNALRVTATVSNPSADNSYASRLNCSLRKYDSAEAAVGDYTSATLQRKNISIEKSGSTDVTFEYTGLECGKFYCLRFTYTQGYEEDGVTKTRTQQALITDRYQMTEGYLVYNPDLSISIRQSAAEIDAGNALCLDLREISSDISVTPSSNANCIYLLAETAETPSGISDCNIVRGAASESITLQDGCNFYTPITFTAANITYNRTFTLPAAASSGWNTICLPFDVSEVTVADGSQNGKTVDWFRSGSDTGKNFWLKTFTGDSDGHVWFDYADEFAANTPYIIAVPGDTWGEEWQMTGKTVSFKGTGATISATSSTSVGGNYYNFCASTMSADLTDVYVLNADGGAFEKQLNVNSCPFRAWIAAVDISSLTAPMLTISGGMPSPVQTPLTEGAGSAKTSLNICDLSGHTISAASASALSALPKGLYIINGKKYISR